MVLLQRFMAVILLVIPGMAGAYGWKLMRDSFFDNFKPEIGQFLWWKFAGGLTLFIIGIGFIAGYIFHRDKKRRLVQRRFLNDDDD